MAEDKDEEQEVLADEARDAQVTKSLYDIAKRFRDLYGYDPDGLSIFEMQNSIADEMARRGLRPYKL